MSSLKFFHEDEAVKLDSIDALIVAGWTGRNAAAVDHHVQELKALGVAPPSSVPLYYRVAAGLLVTDSAIQVVGPDTSGEAEPLLVQSGGSLWLGLGSDHTDRALEAHSVALSKQACAKPCASTLWSFDDVSDRLDTLQLRSWVSSGDPEQWTLYQEGDLSAIRPLTTLHEHSGMAGMAGMADDTSVAMLCGTLPAIGGVRAADRFRCELHDPHTARVIRLEYRIATLPEVQ